MNKSAFPLVTQEEKKLPFYLRSVGGMENQDHISRPSGYPDYHWLHSTKGKGVLVIAGKEHFISEGMGFFFIPGISHEYYPFEEPWETHWITFNGYAVPSILEIIGLDSWGIYHITNMQQIEMQLSDIYAKAASTIPRKGFECSYLLYKFLIDLKNHMNTGESRTEYYKYNQIQPVITYLESHYSSNPTLDEMAALINVTPQHLCRLFKQTLNMRPFVYFNKFRIQKAKEIMLQPDCPAIKEITKKVGYNDTSYFCALFKEYEGVTPMEFKKMHRAV